MSAYSQGDPRQKIQLCSECYEPTGSCEEDHAYFQTPAGLNLGPLCGACQTHLSAIYPEVPAEGEKS